MRFENRLFLGRASDEEDGDIGAFLPSIEAIDAATASLATVVEAAATVVVASIRRTGAAVAAMEAAV